ncbi:hypothetical protein [Zongyangia hominis]|uniref:Uncharacterized protein n=1 Tax=Zongyangia hominis TaxID=2763677 RepID=A0A926E8L9_9FIRM|nr:hypothetical protein [Zongyangia hominis]MBC8569900.1 hypothetical protein [Zongyangia hominis]
MEKKTIYEIKDTTIEVERVFSEEKRLKDVLIEWLIQEKTPVWRPPF